MKTLEEIKKIILKEYATNNCFSTKEVSLVVKLLPTITQEEVDNFDLDTCYDGENSTKISVLIMIKKYQKQDVVPIVEVVNKPEEKAVEIVEPVEPSEKEVDGITYYLGQDQNTNEIKYYRLNGSPIEWAIWVVGWCIATAIFIPAALPAGLAFLIRGFICHLINKRIRKKIAYYEFNKMSDEEKEQYLLEKSEQELEIEAFKEAKRQELMQKIELEKSLKKSNTDLVIKQEVARKFRHFWS